MKQILKIETEEELKEICNDKEIVGHFRKIKKEGLPFFLGLQSLGDLIEEDNKENQKKLFL